MYDEYLVFYLYIYIAPVTVHTNQMRLHAFVSQSNCVRRTCSRSLHSNCLRRGSNPYFPCYWPSAL